MVSCAMPQWTTCLMPSLTIFYLWWPSVSLLRLETETELRKWHYHLCIMQRACRRWRTVCINYNIFYQSDLSFFTWTSLPSGCSACLLPVRRCGGDQNGTSSSQVCQNSSTTGKWQIEIMRYYVGLWYLQVVRAGCTLAAKPNSGIAQKNMSVFKKTWMENVTLLTDAVNAITPLLDFTAVTGIIYDELNLN